MLLFLKQNFPPSPYLIPGSIYFKSFVSIYSLGFGRGKTWGFFIPAIQYLSDGPWSRDFTGVLIHKLGYHPSQQGHLNSQVT